MSASRNEIVEESHLITNNRNIQINVCWSKVRSYTGCPIELYSFSKRWPVLENSVGVIANIGLTV